METEILAQRTRQEAPAKGWFNRFRVLPQDDHYVENGGRLIEVGEHDDVNIFPSKDAAETFAIETMAQQTPAVRAAVIWLGAFPVEGRKT